MKQKIIISFSVLLLLFSVFLIARDLFRHPSPATPQPCCGDDLTIAKKLDSALIGYVKTRVINTGLTNLTGIALNNDDRVFVSGNGRITEFKTDGSKLIDFPVDTLASCIAVNGDDIYIGAGYTVYHYKTNGTRTGILRSDAHKGHITSIGINEGFIYAADAVSKRIIKFSPDGKLISEIGRKDTATGAPGFVLPSMYFDIAFDSFNGLWAANTGRLRLENYTAKGIFESSWGISSIRSEGFAGCCNPAHFALLPDGGFITYEKGIDKIKEFGPTGQFICLVAGAGSFRGKTDLQLGNNNLVKDIATGSDGKVYILDAYNQVNIFTKKDI